MEEKALAVEATEDLPMFDISDTVLRTGEAHLRGRKVKLSHELRQPTTVETKEYDKAQPYRSVSVDDNVDQVLSDLSGKADVRLYDLLVVRTGGYGKNVEPEQSQEERKAALAGIPPRHKAEIARALIRVTSKVVYDDSEPESETFTWTDNQEYRVRTDIGDFVIYTNIKEPTQKHLDMSSDATKFYIEKGGKKPVTRITTDIDPAVVIFDESVQNVEGLSLGSAPVDVKNAHQLRAIPAYIKRSIVDAVMAETKLDLGE